MIREKSKVTVVVGKVGNMFKAATTVDTFVEEGGLDFTGERLGDLLNMIINHYITESGLRTFEVVVVPYRGKP